MKSPSSPHGTQAWLSTVRAYNLCETVISRRLADIQLRVGDLEVLATLATTPKLSQRELAARCFITKSGVSMLLTQMEERGLVIRAADAGDARAKRLTLTSDGTRLAAQAMKIQAEVVNAMVAGLSEQELADINRVMNRVSAQLEELL
jgi:DNA-binding MarR family transcriptional regulator